jgi:hypothetical protein
MVIYNQILVKVTTNHILVDGDHHSETETLARHVPLVLHV